MLFQPSSVLFNSGILTHVKLIVNQKIHIFAGKFVKMTDLDSAFIQLNFKWLPKHLNHITENIVFKKRNISFLAINAIFRQKDISVTSSEISFTNSFIISGFVPVQANDKLRTRAEKMSVIFRIDEHNNIIPITSYSETDAE